MLYEYVYDKRGKLENLLKIFKERPLVPDYATYMNNQLSLCELILYSLLIFEYQLIKRIFNGLSFVHFFFHLYTKCLMKFPPIKLLFTNENKNLLLNFSTWINLIFNKPIFNDISILYYTTIQVLSPVLSFGKFETVRKAIRLGRQIPTLFAVEIQKILIYLV